METVKKAQAAMASRWLRRKASQRLAGSALRGIRFIQREIVLSEISKPSMRSSPWMRGAPQPGFSAIIWKMRSRTSFDVGLLPTGFRTFEIRLQYQRNPARCHRTTVSGVTTMRTCFHPDQNLCAKIQKTLSNTVSLGLGRLRRNVTSCRRRSKFSKSRARRAKPRQGAAATYRPCYVATAYICGREDRILLKSQADRVWQRSGIKWSVGPRFLVPAVGLSLVGGGG